MAQLSSVFGAIGNGAQSLFGTSALSGAGSAAAGSAGAGSAVNSAMASGAPTAAMDTATQAFGSGSGVGDFLGTGLSKYEFGQTVTPLIGQMLESGGNAPQAPDAGGGMMHQLAKGGSDGDRVNWATPMSGQNSIIQALLSRGIGNG